MLQCFYVLSARTVRNTPELNQDEQTNLGMFTWDRGNYQQKFTGATIRRRLYKEVIQTHKQVMVSLIFGCKQLTSDEIVIDIKLLLCNITKSCSKQFTYDNIYTKLCILRYAFPISIASEDALRAETLRQSYVTVRDRIERLPISWEIVEQCIRNYAICGEFGQYFVATHDFYIKRLKIMICNSTLSALNDINLGGDMRMNVQRVTYMVHSVSCTTNSSLKITIQNTVYNK